jgi:hypothetical protein
MYKTILMFLPEILMVSYSIFLIFFMVKSYCIFYSKIEKSNNQN